MIALESRKGRVFSYVEGSLGTKGLLREDKQVVIKSRS